MNIILYWGAILIGICDLVLASGLLGRTGIVDKIIAKVKIKRNK